MKFYDVTFFVDEKAPAASADYQEDSPWPITVNIQTGDFKDGRIKIHFSKDTFFKFCDSIIAVRREAIVQHNFSDVEVNKNEEVA